MTNGKQAIINFLNCFSVRYLPRYDESIGKLDSVH